MQGSKHGENMEIQRQHCDYIYIGGMKDKFSIVNFLLDVLLVL